MTPRAALGSSPAGARAQRLLHAARTLDGSPAERSPAPGPPHLWTAAASPPGPGAAAGQRAEKLRASRPRETRRLRSQRFPSSLGSRGFSLGPSARPDPQRLQNALLRSSFPGPGDRQLGRGAARLAFPLWGLQSSRRGLWTARRCLDWRPPLRSEGGHPKARNPPGPGRSETQRNVAAGLPSEESHCPPAPSRLKTVNVSGQTPGDWRCADRRRAFSWDS